jgi:hypothetical protein
MSFEKGELYDWIDIENQAKIDGARMQEYGLLDLNSRVGETFLVVKSDKYTASFVLTDRRELFMIIYECVMFINRSEV